MWHDIASAVRDLQRAFSGAVDTYRPELHYMRGPGPKCQAKRRGIARPVTAKASDAQTLDQVAQARA
jgi:hypothetical protein